MSSPPMTVASCGGTAGREAPPGWWLAAHVGPGPTLRPMPAPKARNCSASCMASSLQGQGGMKQACMRPEQPHAATGARLVGVRTRAKTPYGLAARRCRTGSAKVAVLPLPVCAVAITLRPCAFTPLSRARGSKQPGS